jgi:hypothetical protein
MSNKNFEEYKDKKTIDCTPTWFGIMQIYIAQIVEQGWNATAGIEEIKRLATSMDKVNAEIRERKEKDQVNLTFEREEWDLIVSVLRYTVDEDDVPQNKRTAFKRLRNQLIKLSEDENNSDTA